MTVYSLTIFIKENQEKPSEQLWMLNINNNANSNTNKYTGLSLCYELLQPCSIIIKSYFMDEETKAQNSGVKIILLISGRVYIQT